MMGSTALRDSSSFSCNFVRYNRLRLSEKENLYQDHYIGKSRLDSAKITGVNLKKLCDEVFGAVNFIGQITVVGNPRGRDYGGVARMHDYLFVYKKSPETTINLIEDPDNNFKMFDNLGGFELRELRNRNISQSSAELEGDMMQEEYMEQEENQNE